MSREREPKQCKKKIQKSKKGDRIKKLRDSDDSTAKLTSSATPTTASSSKESRSPRSFLNDESQSSFVSELTWIDSEGSGNRRSSLTPNRQSPPPASMNAPRRQKDRKVLSAEDVSHQLPRASITSTISSKESLPESSFSDSQSSLVSELTWLGSEGSSIKRSSLVFSKLAASKQSPKPLLDRAMPQQPSNDDSQSSIVSELTWLGSQRSIKPRCSSLAVSIPEAPPREEDDGSRDKSSSDGSSKTGRRKGKKKSRKESNSKESTLFSHYEAKGQTNATTRGFPSDNQSYSPRLPRSSKATKRRSLEAQSNPKSLPESPRLAHESPKASYRKRAVGSSKAHGDPQRSLSTSLHQGDSSKSSRPMSSAESPNPPRPARQVRGATKQTRRNSMTSVESAKPAHSAWQVREATKHARRNSMASAESPKPAQSAWQVRGATKQSRRKSVTFEDGKLSKEDLPPAFAMIRDWSEGTLDTQPSFSKASASRLSPPRSTEDRKRRGVQSCPSIPKRSSVANVDVLLDRLYPSLHDDEQRKDKAPVLPSHGRAVSPPERRQPGQALKSADSIQSAQPKQEKEKVKVKAPGTPRALYFPKTFIGGRAEMQRSKSSKNRRNSVNASMRNLLIDQTQTLLDMD
jgi:hypothetical protein